MPDAQLRAGAFDQNQVLTEDHSLQFTIETKFRQRLQRFFTVAQAGGLVGRRDDATRAAFHAA